MAHDEQRHASEHIAPSFKDGPPPNPPKTEEHKGGTALLLKDGPGPPSSSAKPADLFGSKKAVLPEYGRLKATNYRHEEQGCYPSWYRPIYDERSPRPLSERVTSEPRARRGRRRGRRRISRAQPGDSGYRVQKQSSAESSARSSRTHGSAKDGINSPLFDDSSAFRRYDGGKLGERPALPRGEVLQSTRCAHCGVKGHTLAICAWPADDGYVHGCPWCNTMRHTLKNCPHVPRNSNRNPLPPVLWFFGITCRGNKPPHADVPKWAELMRISESQGDGLYTGWIEPTDSFPWLPSTSRDFHRRGKAPWQDLNYVTALQRLPAEPATKDLECVRAQYHRICDEPGPDSEARRLKRIEGVTLEGQIVKAKNVAWGAASARPSG
ncbi:hypothetical protein LIA77_10816 [Sarocladium implicatum]|nr:hypothetical protein LIA77_10816 [Sarocladium implicatum]